MTAKQKFMGAVPFSDQQQRSIFGGMKMLMKAHNSADSKTSLRQELQTCPSSASQL